EPQTLKPEATAALQPLPSQGTEQVTKAPDQIPVTQSTAQVPQPIPVPASRTAEQPVSLDSTQIETSPSIVSTSTPIIPRTLAGAPTVETVSAGPLPSPREVDK